MSAAAADAKGNKGKAATAATAAADDGEKEAFVDFAALSPEALHSYVSYYNLAQAYPPDSTSSSTDKNGNSSNGNSGSRKAAGSGETDDPPCPPHFFDANAADLYLSQVASRHFAAQPPPKEGEVVVGFLYKCKAKGELNKPLAHYRIAPSDQDTQRQQELQIQQQQLQQQQQQAAASVRR